MRLTSLILLASAALALTVQAQERHIVDVVLQVNGEIQTQDGQSPTPDVTAPRRQGQANEPQSMSPAIPEVFAPKQHGKGVVQADAADPFAPEVAAPKPRNHGLQANAVRPACPQVTAPRRESIGDAPKVNFDGAVASVDDEDETFDVVGVPVPEVTAPKMPVRRLEDEEPFADSADPEVTAHKVPGKGIKKIVKVKILRRGDDVVVVEAGDAIPGTDVKAPAPKVTAPVVEADGVTALGPEVAAPSRPDKHIAEVKVRVNGKVVTDGDEALENAQVVIPDPDVTTPAPPKPGTTAPSNPDKHIAEDKVVHEESALEEKLSASNSQKKTAGLLDGLLDGLLGIDINLGGKMKSKNAPADDEKDWHRLRLYGDDGYEPRPLSVQPDGEPNCEVLPFRDQMIWDQQGNRGHYFNAPNSNAEKASEEGIPKAETIANSADDGTDAAPPSSSSPHTYEIINGKKIADIKDNKGTVDANEIHICLFGPCDEDSVDKDTRIHHKMKKFLKQFKGKALRIDSRTGCPLSSDKLTQENT
ncbi:hypothetical protein BG006_002906 [Podila minutissima]|uniref:Uncharacterized protein n=1 Tax=Podila minutissima TaxID=64525 RepID=A0A9P5VNJ1_9FUNG|nr:hypothetical protein BG006_002906 [Podila minutissima]